MRWSGLYHSSYYTSHACCLQHLCLVQDSLVAGMETKGKQTDHSPAARTEQLPIHPSIVSGEGLLGCGLTENQVSADLHRMQEENVKTLSAMSEAELQQEKAALMQNLSE